METKEEYIKRHSVLVREKITDENKVIVFINHLALVYDKRIEENKKIKERDERIVEMMIPKNELVDGGLYIGPRDLARDMWFGVWDKKKDVFQCMRYKMGGFRIFELPYFGDVEKENGVAGMAPVKRIEEVKVV